MAQSVTLPTEYQTYMHVSKYSRWRDDLGRRETWEETVDRYIDFWRDRVSVALPESLRGSLLDLGVVPSMRCLMTAGPALAKDECAGYNCTYVTINRPEAWDEAMYLLMCGVGVGYSVETRYVSQLPVVPTLRWSPETVVVEDSKYGWASSLRRLVERLYTGEIPDWDLSRVRPAGSVLRTFGGRASGPEPLGRLFQHVVEVFVQAQGRRLTERECHSVCCKIGDVVICGGVRRTAMIALFSEDDRSMMTAKSGDWFIDEPHLAMANNSAVWERTPSAEEFHDSFLTLIHGKAGEPGFFNRAAAKMQAARWGKRPVDVEYGCNPCGEIILRDRQMCNLSEVIARPGDSQDDLLEKIEIATIFGTLQSTLTDFRYLSPEWKENCEEERLLGVSIAGIPDHPLLRGDLGKRELERFLDEKHDRVVGTNADWAAKLGINPSTALTCLKPSGNTSQLVGAASPLKAHHAPRYVRRTRAARTDPVTRLLIDEGVPHEPEAWHPDETVVFEWAIEAPEGAITRHDWTAVQQLELWLTYRDHWCDHNPSVTINVRSDEWVDVLAWTWRHWDKMTGVTFLPDEDHTYAQAPYEEVSEYEWNDLWIRHPNEIDWSRLSEYETDDRTESARELACSAGVCVV